MSGYVLPGLCGLFLGLTLQWTGFHRPAGMRSLLGLRRSYALRSGLEALGMALALTALLCWLAVIDVDTIRVLPLSGGVLAGGVVFGVAAGLCGFTPFTAFAGLGGGPALPALCTLAGCLGGTLLTPLLTAPFAALQALPPQADATVFRTTLDEPFLLDGGFLGQGCAGLLLMAIALCIPSPKAAPEPASRPTEATEASPEALPEETFVALLPGEEPLVVDTAIDEADAPEEEAPTEEAEAAEDTPDEAQPDAPNDDALIEEAEAAEDTPDEPETDVLNDDASADEPDETPPAVPDIDDVPLPPDAESLAADVGQDDLTLPLLSEELPPLKLPRGDIP